MSDRQANSMEHIILHLPLFQNEWLISDFWLELIGAFSQDYGHDTEPASQKNPFKPWDEILNPNIYNSYT